MKIVILCGGLGTRLAEETDVIPKPMVEIGGRPILWHIMKHYAHFGFNEFVIALGYKGEVIKDFFTKYHLLNDNFTTNTKSGEVSKHNDAKDEWVVHLIDTGIEAMTGGRIKRLAKWIGNETFALTYGDGLSNVNLKDLLQFHRSHGKSATLTAIKPPAKFGEIVFDGDRIVKFSEKPKNTGTWINGGFFFLEPEVLNYIDGYHISWEREPLETLAKEGRLMAYRHEGFWQCVDNLKDLRHLRQLWKDGNAAWKIWSD